MEKISKPFKKLFKKSKKGKDGDAEPATNGEAKPTQAADTKEKNEEQNGGVTVQEEQENGAVQTETTPCDTRDPEDKDVEVKENGIEAVKNAEAECGAPPVIEEKPEAGTEKAEDSTTKSSPSEQEKPQSEVPLADD